MSASYSHVETPARDLVVDDRWGTVVLTVDPGHGEKAAALATRCSVEQERRRYTKAARANVELESLPGYAEAKYDRATGDAYTPERYPR